MWGMTGRVRCRHGFPSEICPSCAGLGESNPLVSVEAKALNKLSERYAKALAVVEAARADEHGLCDDGCGSCVVCNRDWPCRTAVTLAAFDEVEGP